MSTPPTLAELKAREKEIVATWMRNEHAQTALDIELAAIRSQIERMQAEQEYDASDHCAIDDVEPESDAD